MTWRDIAAELDTQIAQLEHQLYDLRAKRNSITPFYRLPNETLEQILLLVQPVSYNDSFVGSDYRGSHWVSYGLKWVQAMGICRCVRNAALASAVLWSKVDLDHKNLEWIELCLQRARNHVLTLNGSVRHTDDQRTLRVLDLFPRASCVRVRIQPLKLSEEYLYDDEHDDALDALAQICLCKHQENLVSMELYDEHDLAPPDWDYFIFDGAKFLGGSSINLIHLLLDKIHFDSVPFMPLLQRLIIYQMPNSLACVELRAMLVQTPALMLLYVHGSYEPFLPHNQFPLQIPEICGRPVDLPHLSDLRLSGTMAQVSQILQLFPPTHTMLNFELSMPDESHGYINPLSFMEHLPALSHHIQTRVAHQLASISAEHTLDCKIEGSEYNGGVKIVEIDMAETYPPRTSSRRVQSVRLLCPIAADISNLVCHAVNVEVVDRHHMSDLVPDLIGSHRMLTLVAVNVSLATEFQDMFCEPREESEFERVLSGRAKTQGGPIAILIMRYYGTVEDLQWLPFPPSEARNAAESRWKTANWVSKVRWDNWEGC